MRSAWLLSVGLWACGETAAVPKPPPSTPEPPVETNEPEANQVATESSEHPWDPSRPIGTEGLDTLAMFVVVDRSSVCPTREQALARDCGNSVENVTRGRVVPRGTRVIVVAGGPRDGLYKALRFQKAGLLPGWIRADDVAEQPDATFLETWDALPDVAAAREVANLSASELTALPKGAVVKWRRTRALRYGELGDGIVVYLAPDSGALAAIELPAPSESNDYPRHHSCLMDGACLRLDYQCGSTYCDEVSILARASGQSVPAPKDPEGQWQPVSAQLPLFEGIALADRFGIFPRVHSP